MLFGNGKFDTIFGDLSFYDMDFTASQDSPFDADKYEQKQNARRQQLTHQLIIKLEPFVQGEKSGFISMVCRVGGLHSNYHYARSKKKSVVYLRYQVVKTCF